MQHPDWPDHLPVTQVRIARPTNQLESVVAFYRDGLGLPVIGSFSGHDGYDGVMIGLPGAEYHLEFTQHVGGSAGTAPSNDNLLVLYIADRAAFEQIVDRLEERGHYPVASENPYWTANDAVTIADPDGWRVVVMPTRGITPRVESTQR